MRLGTFTPSVLLALAGRTGLLAERGLEVEEVPVPSSPGQFCALADGELDLVVTSPDNVLAYRFLDNPLGERLDVLVTAALDSDAGLTLAARPGLGDLALGELVLGVDVPTSGFAFAAYALLESAGRPPGSYEVRALGSTPRRRAALAAGECDVTILGAGNELLGEAAGCRPVAGARSLGPYLGEVLARLAGSPSAPEADALAEVLVEVAERVRGGELVEETVSAAEDVLGLPRDLARRHHARLTGGGLVPEGRAPREAFGTLLALRRRFRPEPGLEEAAAGLEAMLVGRALRGQVS